jgi:MSHA biogenesis protein MshJ
MKAKLLQMLNRLEALSPRERVMVVLGAPLVLLVAGELLLFGPAGKQTEQARKQAEQQQAELKAVGAALAAQPVVAPLPGADQLLRQRTELQSHIDTAAALTAGLDKTIDWGTVVRATVAGTPGLTLSQLKTMPAELVFTPSAPKPAAAPASAPRVAAAPATAGPAIYRHRAELIVTGHFGALLGYLQTLQRVPGDLRWDRLQLSVAAYPQASVQLTLHTLSNRAETPFN